MTEAVEDLAAWLTAVWDEEEHRERAKRAWGNRPPPAVMQLDGRVHIRWASGLQQELTQRAFDHLYVHPAMDHERLARIAADRKILARCMAIWSRYEEGGSLCELARAVDARLMMHDLASPYRDRPDFPGETLVERQGVEQ